MTGTEIYKRTPAYDREAQTIRLHAPHWKLLLAFDGQRSLSEVALSAEIPFAETLPLTQKFLDSSWIEEMPITLEQYLKRTGARDLSGTGAAVPSAVVLHGPQGTAPAAPTATATPVAPIAPPPLPPSPAPSIKPADAPKPATPPTASATSAPTASSPTVRPMRLSAVVDFVTSLVGNISLGQLLVYRVFLRVPPELLLAEDVASVHLVQDTSLIKGDKLQKAIADAVQAVAKRQLPDSVFAAA
jgi:hypothetical protein